MSETVETLPFKEGHSYLTQEGKRVTILKAKNTPFYEVVQGDDMATPEGGHRYNRPGDRGRCTGTAHDFSDQRNLVPLKRMTMAQAKNDFGWLGQIRAIHGIGDITIVEAFRVTDETKHTDKPVYATSYYGMVDDINLSRGWDTLDKAIVGCIIRKHLETNTANYFDATLQHVVFARDEASDRMKEHN